MGESRMHMNLVVTGANYAKSIVPVDYSFLVQYDSPDSKKPTKAIKDFIPDIFFWHNDLLIIGEAKTIDDFDRNHSMEQYTAYLNECKEFYGEAKIIIAVPWQLVATAKNYFRRLRKELCCDDVEVIIINELGKAFII